jgi:hypothetical protein
MKATLLLLIFACIIARQSAAQPCMDITANAIRNWVEIPNQKKALKTAQESSKKYTLSNGIISATHHAERIASVELPDFVTLINRKTYCNPSPFRFPFGRNKCEEKRQFLLEAEAALRKLCTVSTQYKITNGIVRQIENEYNDIMNLLLLKMHE